MTDEQVDKLVKAITTHGENIAHALNGLAHSCESLVDVTGLHGGAVSSAIEGHADAIGALADAVKTFPT